jgi:hypothetical protein
MLLLCGWCSMVQQHGISSSTKHLLFNVLVLQLRLFVRGCLDGGKVSSLLLNIALLLAVWFFVVSTQSKYLQWRWCNVLASSQDEGQGSLTDHGREQLGEDSPLSVQTRTIQCTTDAPLSPWALPCSMLMLEGNANFTKISCLSIVCYFLYCL